MTADLTLRELSDLRFAIRADRVAAVRGLEWPTARVERVVAGIKAAAMGAEACCCCAQRRGGGEVGHGSTDVVEGRQIGGNEREARR